MGTPTADGACPFARGEAAVVGDPPGAPLLGMIRSTLGEFTDDPGTLTHMMVVRNEHASMELLLNTVRLARCGQRLGIQCSSSDWPSIRRAALDAHHCVSLHWQNFEAGAERPDTRQPLALENTGDLHAWVSEAAEGPWRLGQYRQAVLDAATALETHTRSKLGRRDLHGTRLYAAAFASTFAPDRPQLYFPFDQPHTPEWRSTHEAAKYLGMAVTMGIRNWAAHTTAGLHPQVALEYLATLSVLSRWVEAAVLHPALPTPGESPCD